jgi:acyl-lipid (7-3)-desaturase (Delta-4 desaturase)
VILDDVGITNTKHIIFSYFHRYYGFNPDVVVLKDGSAAKAGLKMDNQFLISRRKYAVVLRLIYFYCTVGGPLYHHGVTAKALGNIFLMGVVGSLVAGNVLILNHCFEGCNIDPIKIGGSRNIGDKDKNGDNTGRAQLEPVCWYKSSVETACTFGGPLSSWLTGGLSMQCEHHLFPRMNSSWLPYIQPTVRRVCAKHGVNYTYFPTILHGLVSMLKQMNNIGNGTTCRGKVD